MAINTLSVDQASTILNAAVAQAKGGTVASLATKDFVTVAKTGLATGYDPLMTAISQVLSRTIFSMRPYNRKLQVLEADPIRYGNHVRKLNMIDGTLENDDRYGLTTGVAVDPYVVEKPKVLQTNWFGSQTWQKRITIYKDQIDVSLSSPEEFARFVTMVMTNITDQLEQAREEAARMTMLNLIGGTASSGVATQQVHLVTEYMAWAGITTTPWNYADPANFPDFARWCFGRIKTASQALENRTTLYHVNPTTAHADNPNPGTISRHSPVSEQRLILFGPVFNTVDASVLSVSFNDQYLKLLKNEMVNFWQSPATPNSISVNQSHMAANGTIANAAYTSTTVLGVLYDREAAGYTLQNQWSGATPFNPRGGYTNYFFHETARYWMDSTENAIVFLLD